jgi:hypothetical protein
MDPNESDDVTLAREAFARALRVKMIEGGVNIRDLAHRTREGGAVGMAETTLGRYVRAEQSPRWTEQVLLADALGVDVVDLIAYAVAEFELLKGGGASKRATRIRRITH